MKLALRSNVGGAIAMMIARILLAFATCVLAASAQAATFFASREGAGTACSSSSPCSLSQLISKVQAGDIGIVNAGTYTGDITTKDKSGTAAEPITLRAQNFAVTCTDPVNDPDGCQVANTASRSFLIDFGLVGLRLLELGGIPNPGFALQGRLGHQSKQKRPHIFRSFHQQLQ